MPSYPYIRRAADDDYSAIWRIWMQDHVIKWMSFSKQSLEDFKEKYDYLKSTSDIYVMVDSINGQEQVVGVRRIKYLKDAYAHTAEFCSMGVIKELQGRGYGKKFTQEFEKIVREKKNISRIQLTQSGGNERAFFIADKNGYHEEAVFPDWLEREGHDGHHYFIIERFIYKFIDPDLEKQASNLPSLSYDTKLPKLYGQDNLPDLVVALVNNKITVSIDQSPIITIDYFPDQSVVQHIGFLENLSLHSKDSQLCAAALRKALQFIHAKGNVKKLELFVNDSRAASICQDLGFWVRGERSASYYQEGQYSNELGIEYSFFGIKEARDLLMSFDNIPMARELNRSLTRCQHTIAQLFEAGECDQLGRDYLENIVYQMLRDRLALEKLVSLQGQPWQVLINHCPKLLRTELQNLSKQLQTINNKRDSAAASSNDSIQQQDHLKEDEVRINRQHKPNI